MTAFGLPVRDVGARKVTPGVRAGLRPRRCVAIASWLLACVVPFCAAAALAADDGLQKVPPLTARVTDLTGTLDAGQSAAIDSDLAALEQRKGAQLGVLLVPTTAPEDIAQYGIRVADAWKLGRKGTDDGAILIVAKNDRRVRIEVGRGLEGAIPDATADRIIREYVAPKFRANDYAGGIRDATGALIKLVDGEPLPPPLTPERTPRKSTDGFNSLVVVLFAIVWARAFFGRVPVAPRGGLVGLVGGGAGWLLTGGLLSATLGFGVLGLILGLLGGAGGGFANRGGWSAFPGGFGGLGGGGGFGGGGGGGGFSGGGGGFAGGGASGSW